jgi:hypothetical protein
MASLYVTVEQVGFVLERAGQIPEIRKASASELPVESDEAQTAARTAERDPLVAMARAYATGSLRVLQALRERLARRGDGASIDAADRLEETCITVASKVHRAVSSALNGGADPGDLQSDSNGSAKVALLLIEESKQAWRTLMRPGHAVGNGTPAGFVATLDTLEAGLHARFPRALEFVRPGFDTIAHGAPGGIARALLGSPPTTRN